MDAFVLIVSLACTVSCEVGGIPQDFPTFHVPGAENEMSLLRDLFWLHYPGAGPKATLWDEWLPDASLWPAVETEGSLSRMRKAWRTALSARILDPEGYVATHQHASIAHQLGWPFPFWNQGRRGFGWHFSFKNTVGANWRPKDLNRPDGWILYGAKDAGMNDEGWVIQVEQANALITPPKKRCHTFEVPFVQLRWKTEGLGECQPFIEWAPADGDFDVTRRMYFDPPAKDGIVYSMIPLYRHPLWQGEIDQLRIGLRNSQPGQVVIQALFSQYDTRHNINAQNFIRGCAKYFFWTRDLAFLRANIQRMRTALRFLMHEHQTLARNVVFTDWVGHDGRSGLRIGPEGKKEVLTGQGIGNNYWDLLPFGWFDCYATIQYYDAVRTLAEIEREIKGHPEWNIPGGFLAFNPEELERHAEEVKRTGNQLFWNPTTGRFVACLDRDGQSHDYGYTFLNLEAIHYGFASEEHAKAIMQWITGERTVDGDTSQGADIYHWRFAPRASTRRNVEWYFWAWQSPESIPWGGQVQDGGAVLGFSYHDLSARLKTLGPDNAWERLQEILRWFAEVQAAGGYRKYYDGSRDGSLQGGGTPGGLGMDHEFFESVLVPQIMLYGFLGFAPKGDGFGLDPQLPANWPELSLDRIAFQDLVLQIRATRSFVEMTSSQSDQEPVVLRLPERYTTAKWITECQGPRPEREENGAWRVMFPSGGTLRIESPKQD